ncbi:MAG: hypothetical protein ACREVJ_03115 [Gammaproteobacteria bacterium]
MARGTATMMGMAVMLAIVLGVGTTALAAVPGDPFKLGKTNTIDKITKLVGDTSTALLRVENEGTGPALDLQVEPGEPPMTVDSATKVEDLNADQVDGKGADNFISEDRIYQVSNTGSGSAGGGTPVVVFAHCDSGDKVLGGGGGGAVFDPDTLRLSDPFGQGTWRVVVQDNSTADSFVAKAICADFPPLRP